jgi:flagellar basal body rod protein FlgG
LLNNRVPPKRPPGYTAEARDPGPGRRTREDTKVDIGSYIAASGATASELVLENIAHNLANASTPSFKKVMMQQRCEPFSFPGSDASVPEGLGFPRLGDPVHDDAQGELIPTGNPYDLAIEGKGCFEVQGPQGVERIRNGQFRIGPEGNLVTTRGLPVLNEQGQAVRIARDKIVEFAPNGEINVGDARDGVFTRQGRLRVVDENGAALREEDYEIRQRHLEMSNVNPVQEMVKMLEQMRSHQSYVELIKGFADLEEKTATELGKF